MQKGRTCLKGKIVARPSHHRSIFLVFQVLHCVWYCGSPNLAVVIALGGYRYARMPSLAIMIFEVSCVKDRTSEIDQMCLLMCSVIPGQAVSIGLRALTLSPYSRPTPFKDRLDRGPAGSPLTKSAVVDRGRRQASTRLNLTRLCRRRTELAI